MQIIKILKLSLLLLLLQLPFLGWSQGATCATADPFCSNSGATFPAGVNQPAAPVGNNYSCLNSQPNPAWYYLQVGNSGNLNFTLTNSAGVDIDFILWGPFPNVSAATNSCGSLGTGGVNGSVIACSYSPSPIERCTIPSAQSGQVYILLITNFSNQPTNISANQTSGSGSTNCDILLPCAEAGFQNITNGGAAYNCATSSAVSLTAFPASASPGNLSITPGFNFSIQTDANSNSQNTLRIFDGPNGTGNIVAYWGPSNTGGNYMGSVPNSSNFQGTIEYLDSLGNYSMTWCDTGNDGTFTTLITHSGSNTIIRNTPLNGSTGCTTINLGAPDGFPLFTGPGVTNTRNGRGIFDPALAGAGIHTISYIWRSQAGCTDTATQTVVVCCNNPPARIISVAQGNDTLCVGDSLRLTANAPSFSGSTTTFSNTTQQTIPVRSTITSTINVQGVCPFTISSGIIQSICVNIDQRLTNDINLTLIAPDGTRMDLSSGNGGRSIQYRNTCFSPSAITNITSFTGTSVIPDNSSFLPEQSFNVLNGRPLNGIWTLEIVHTKLPSLGGQSGTLRSWSINLAPAATTPSYTWSGSNMSCTNCQSPTISPTTNSIYRVTATTPCGCQFTDSIPIVVIPPLPAPSNFNCTPTTSSIEFSWDAVTGALGYEVSTDNGATWTAFNGMNNAAPTHTLTNLGLTQTVTILVRALSNGCPSAIDSTSCTTLNCPVTASIQSQTDVTCHGGNNGSFTISTTGTVGTLSYQITAPTTGTAQASNTFTNLAAGIYTISVTDQSLNCGASVSITLSEPSSISVTSAVISDVQCNGGSDGIVTTTVNGGTPNYNYAWSNGATTATATGLTAGSYCVTVSDVNSCTATVCATVSEPSALSISTSSVDVTCFGGNNGSGSSIVSGGVTPYVYAWSNGATTANLTGLTAGTYDISVTDAHNCQIISTITINQPAASVSVTASSTTALCAGGSTGTATAVALGGIAPHQYLWSANSGSQTTATATGLLAGNYTVTATDNNGCAAATTVVVNDGNGIQISLTSTDASCNGYANGTATAAANGGVGGFTYHWDNGQSTATAVGLVANNYCVTATDANGCGVTGCVLVSQPQGMSNVQFTTQSVSCFGGNDGRATVTLVGGIRPYQYVWDNGTTGATGTGFNAGNHSVTISDANGCTISGTALVPQPTQLQVTAQSDSARCRFNNDGAATATATGGTFPYNYLWSNGRNTAYNGNIIAGTYRVTVTDLNGCTATSGTTVGQPSSAVLANIINSQNASCNGLANGQAEVNGTGGTPNYTYVWTNGQTNSVATGLAAGNHRVTATDQRGCTASASVNISQPTALQATASITSNYNGAHVSCTGDNDGTARVIVTGGTGAYGYAWSTTPAQLTAIATGLTAGTYTVTVTDASGCSLTRSVTLQNPTPLQATEQHVNVFCHGQATGQIIVTATPNTGTVGINGYEYAIYGPNQTGNVFSNVNQYFGLVAGTYTVIVRDGNDCEVPVSIQITEPTILTVQTSKTDATCHTSSTGTATATPTGGTSPYRYAWSNGQTSQTATGLTAGSYQVTVTDNNSCDISQSVLINQPTALQASVTPASASCNGSTNGSAAVVATGGTSPYRYRWTNNQTAGTANGMAAGSYQVTVTDAQGCTAVVPFTITEPTGLTVAVVPQHLTCFNGANGQATATPAGGTAPYTYAWLNGQTTATITGLSAGVQRVIITDANGCQAQAQTTLTQPAIVTGSITAQTATRCANSQDGTATAQGAGGTAPFSYRWSNGQTTAIATGLASNTVYTVTISDANGCNTAITTTIPNPSALAINNTTHQDVLCKGDATGRAVVLAIGGTMPYSYMWSNSQTAAVATGLTAGLYSVTVSDANGCATATQISIAEPTQGLSLLVNATPTLCANDANGQAAAIPAGGTPFTGNSYQYRWSNGRTSRDISGLAAGTYTVTVTDANGCSISRTTTVTNGGTVRIQTQALQQPTCGGGAEGRAIVTASSSNGGNVAFLWSNGATSQTVTGLTAGTYTVTATDTTGCAAMDSVVINDGTRVTDQVTIQPISCFGQADGAITMQTTPAAVIYEWNTGFVGVTGALTNLAAGQYTVTITTAQGCRKAFTYTVTQPDSFTVALAQTQTIACYQDATAAIQSTVQGGTQPVTYAWNTGANTGNISQLSAGGYTLLVTDANGCTATAQLAIGEPAQLVLTLGGTETTCSDSRDGMIALSATGGTLNAGLYEYSLDSIHWQTGNLFPNLASGSYTVLVRDANGCTDLDTLTIQPTAPFFIVAATADTTLEYLDTVQLAVTLNDTTQATSVWTLLGANGGVLDTNVYQVIVAPANTGSYHFVAMNQNGCQVDTTIILTVAKPRNANAPKGFTPNGDGTNDTFFIQGDDKIKSVLAFRVYDRWGELVYEATDLQPNDATAGWDGTLKGKPLNSGVFAWYAEIQYNDGFTVVTKGDVTLLR